jgi:hypothetical protein
LREDVAFTDIEGVERGRDVKWARRAIEKLQEPLRKILEPNEAVLYIARGQVMPGKLQRYTQGTQSRYLEPAALALTNRRVLHLTVNWNGQWNRSVRAARWADIKEGHVTGLLHGILHLEYRQGLKESYWRIPKSAAKKVQLLLDVLLPASVSDAPVGPAMVSFCPDCFNPLTPDVYRCTHCGLKFKDGKTLLLHALLPGGPYFYIGLDLWGVAHACVDVTILASVITWALATMGRGHPDLRAGAPPTKITYALVTALLGSALIYDVWMGIRIARNAVRKFIPET